MRIGLVTACYKPVVNGVTRLVAQYKQLLETAGHQAIVFTLGPADPAGEEASVVRSPAISLGDSGYYFAHRYAGAAQRLLAEMDVVHCHHLVMGLDLARRYCHCPIVYTNHTRLDLYAAAYASLPQPAANAIMRRLWPHLTDHCDAVIAPSPSVRTILRRFGVRMPIEVIENGVELAHFREPPSPLTKSSLGFDQSTVLFVYVGRLSKEKNLDRLLFEFTIASRTSNRLALMLAGDGPQREDIKRQARELGVAGCVRLLGQVTYDQLPNYLAAADAMVTASLTEVHPLTVLEAMAAGLPVAGLAAPGLVDTIVHGETGLLADNAPGRLSQSMVELAADPTRRRDMGRKAAQRSSRYDIQRTVLQTLSLYRRLIDGRLPGSSDGTAVRANRPLTDRLATAQKRPRLPHSYQSDAYSS